MTNNKYQITNIRLYIAILVGKLTAYILKLGGYSASTWPGHLALKIEPKLISLLENRLSRGSIVVSGTNGKTTTASMISHILSKAGFNVVHNRTSANLLNGLASTLILSTKLSRGYPQYVEKSIGVFEVDEGVLPQALKVFKTEVLVLLNLSRDQLDRYAEVGLTVVKWKKALSKLNPAPKIVYYNQDDHLKKVVSGLPKATLCPFAPKKRDHKQPEKLELPRYLAINRQAALETAALFKVDSAKASESLQNFSPVFGRGEILEYQGCKIYLFLAKNPKSFNENLKFQLLSTTHHPPAFLLVLNDNIPDGRDVSWIYDIDPDLLKKVLKGRKVFVSGKRVLDMALRLKYAGIDFKKFKILEKPKRAIDEACSASENLVVLPTYSAMLEVRKMITGRKLE
jgi:UDP-N-acetylmuramyl tripeptide synthase